MLPTIETMIARAIAIVTTRIINMVKTPAIKNLIDTLDNDSFKKDSHAMHVDAGHQVSSSCLQSSSASSKYSRRSSSASRYSSRSRYGENYHLTN